MKTTSGERNFQEPKLVLEGNPPSLKAMEGKEIKTKTRFLFPKPETGTKTKIMGKNFNLSGLNPEVLENSAGNFWGQNQKEEYGHYNPQPGINSNGGATPFDLENWYRQGGEFPSKQPLRSQDFENKLFLVNRQKPRKIKSIFKVSLQMLTVIILILVAGALGGFIFLDRKINLEATQASLNRMSEVLAQESAVLPLPEGELEGEGVAAAKAAIVPQISKVKGALKTPVFNTSGNTNISASLLPQEIDTDQDGISDDVEDKLGTNPFQADTDGDGYLDGTEVKNGYDPLIPAPRKAPEVSSLPKTTISPQVASASGCSLHSGVESASDSGETFQNSSLSQNNTSESTNFGNLSADDYSTLQQFGLSQGDIEKAASGNITNPEKMALQKQIITSPSMQDSISGTLNSIPKMPLPEISDSELNLYDSSRKEDIERYLKDLDQIFEKNLSNLANLDRAVFQDNLLKGNYTELREIHFAFENAYQELKVLSTPRDAKEVQKSFLSFLKMYADLVNEETALSQDPNKVALVLAQVKSFQDLSTGMQKAFEDLTKKYNL